MPEDKTVAYLQAARDALAHVARKMDIGASNKVWPLSEWWGKGAKIACAGSAVNTGEMRIQVNNALKQIELQTGSVSNEDILNVQASWASQFGCGNCGEQSSIAFVYLRDRQIRPLDWMRFDGRDHAFVVIGRAGESDERDYRTWGPEAVLCDPWKGEACRIASATIFSAGSKVKSLFRLS